MPGMPCPPPTARLSFRELTDADVDNLQLIFADPIAMRHYPSTKDIAETQQWIDWSRQNYQRCGHGLWAVHLRSTDEFISQCGLIPQNIRDQQEIEIGYLFRGSHWGHGFATEAAAACRDFGFSNIDREARVFHRSSERAIAARRKAHRHDTGKAPSAARESLAKRSLRLFNQPPALIPYCAGFAITSITA
jgi:[ribosomal protein S5]-alanine N-acetyltransferase